MATSIQRPYKVRTSWEDSKHQLGSYAYVDTAKSACISVYSPLDDEGLTYKVFRDGICIYNPKDDPNLIEPLFKNTKGGNEILKGSNINAFNDEDILPPTAHHYNTVYKKPTEEVTKKQTSIFEKIKNIFRKK